MIKRLYIKNFAIIKEIEIDFLPGLTVITGETGAGKSILLEALGVALGSKADKIMVRNGADRAVIEAKFNDLEIRRLVFNTGRTKSYKNDEWISLLDLKKENFSRVDFHGQHDQQLILNSVSHIDYLDRYCKHNLDVKKLEKIHYDISELKVELNRLDESEIKKIEKLDLLKFQANEIDLINPILDEDIQLKDTFKKLSNIEEIIKSLEKIKNIICDNDYSINEQLNTVQSELISIEKYDSSLSKISNLVKGSILQLDEAITDINIELVETDFNQENLAEIEERLNSLESLKRKYGGSIQSVLDERKNIEKELNSFENLENSQKKISKAIKKKEGIFSKLAILIHEKRKRKSKELSKEIVLAMKELNMGGARFDINIKCDEDSSGFVILTGVPMAENSKGIDKVEFYLSANPGEPTKPLSSVASGGEISRIMLAIKTVFQNYDPVHTLVFDEIDAGISGKAARKVAEHLLHLSQKKQVICITHLSHIATQADNHLHVEKYIKDKQTYVDMKYLNKTESFNVIQELFIGSN